MQVHLCFELGQEVLEHKEGSENLCMGLMPTHTQGSTTVEGIKATRYFQALRH